MSMIGNLARITEAQREALHRRPESISAFLYDGLGPPELKKPSFWGRLFGPQKSPTDTAPAAGLATDDAMDVDKAWHGLHYLFTRSTSEGAFPENFLVCGGRTVGEEDVGYGPARSFTPREVAGIASFLDGVDEAVLRRRLNLREMQEMDIYPSFGSNEPNPDEEWDYLADNFRRMRSFLRETANRKGALLVYLN